MGRQTAPEAEKENINKMGEALGRQYSALWQGVAAVHFRWAEYVDLFKTKERVSVLNKAASSFFRMIQDDLWDAMLLHISRLTDRSNSFGNKSRSNLTIQNLPELIDDPEVKKRVARLVDEAVAESAFCRDWRNRRVAHRDLSVALKQPAKPLQGGSKKQVEDVLAALARVLNEVAGHYKDAQLIFDIPAVGARSLLRVLDDGNRAREQLLDRVRKGQATEEDFKRRPV